MGSLLPFTTYVRPAAHRGEGAIANAKHTRNKLTSSSIGNLYEAQTDGFHLVNLKQKYVSQLRNLNGWMMHWRDAEEEACGLHQTHTITLKELSQAFIIHSNLYILTLQSSLNMNANRALIMLAERSAHCNPL